MTNTTTNTKLFQKTAKKLGLTFKRTPTPTNRSLFYISGNDRFYYGSAAWPGFYPNSTRSGSHITGNKNFTETALKVLGYKTIKTVFLDPAEHKNFKTFLTYAEKNCKKFPVILKPAKGLDGRGIKYIPDLKSLKRELRSFYKRNIQVIQQPIVSEPEYRILVVNHTVELVHSKDFRSVQGDGQTTIKDLLKNIPDADKDNAYVTMQLSLHGHTLKTILREDEEFHTHIVKNSSARHYQSENLPEELKRWSTGLSEKLNIPTMGIDLFIKGELNDTKKYTIIELNSNPGLAHYYKACSDSTQPDRICEKVLRDFFNL